MIVAVIMLLLFPEVLHKTLAPLLTHVAPPPYHQQTKDHTTHMPCTVLRTKTNNGRSFHTHSPPLPRPNNPREKHASRVMERPAVVAVIPVRACVPPRHLSLEGKAALAHSDGDAVGDCVRRIHTGCHYRHLFRRSIVVRKGGGGGKGL